MNIDKIIKLLKIAVIVVLVVAVIGGFGIATETNLFYALAIIIPSGVAAILIYSRIAIIELLRTIKYEVTKKSYEEDIE